MSYTLCTGFNYVSHRYRGGIFTYKENSMAKVLPFIGKQSDNSEEFRFYVNLFYDNYQLLRGDRTNVQVAKDSGVSPTTLSKIQQKNLIPACSVIKKLTAEESKPQNGMTYEKMITFRDHLDRDHLETSSKKPFKPRHPRLDAAICAALCQVRSRGLFPKVEIIEDEKLCDFRFLNEDNKGTRVTYFQIVTQKEIPSTLGHILTSPERTENDAWVFMLVREESSLSELSLPINCLNADIKAVIFDPDKMLVLDEITIANLKE